MKNRFLNKRYFMFLLGAIVGVFLYQTITSVFNSEQLASFKMMTVEDEKPLYWVAPMDPNYRRDMPGQSPMGMDLVPVFADEHSSSNSTAGTIKISPEVVNNLGVRLADVKFKRLKTKIRTVGYVNYDEDQLFHIHPRVEGWIEKLYIKASGNPVIQGQPLYEIYSPALVNAQEEYVLALDRKNNRLINAAEARLKALQLPNKVILTLKANRKVKQHITFYSPQSGVVDNLNIREGFYVKPGTTIMSIGKLDQVWVEAEVFERQSNQIEKGLRVDMTVAFLPGVQWMGTVDYVYPTLDPKTRTIKVRLIFENKANLLKPNMFAEVIIYPNHKNKMILIPNEALIRTGSSNRVVLSLGEGRFKSVEVKVGQVGDEMVEILSGLKVGEQVVSSAHFLLDSESSKTSDFKRMNHSDKTNDQTFNSDNFADAEGIINSIGSNRSINISRGEIIKWGRDAATLDFIVSDKVSMKGLEPGMKLQFTFYIDNDEFIITELYPQTSNQWRNGND